MSNGMARSGWNDADPDTWIVTDPHLDAVPAERRIPWGLTLLEEWESSSSLLFEYTRLQRWQVADAFVANEWTPELRHRLQEMLGQHEIELAQRRRWEKPELQTCDRCRFASSLSMGLVRCRRMPPQVVTVMTAAGQRSLASVWPDVDAALGCGEFKPRPIGAKA